MGPTIRHAYGYTLIGIAFTLYFWSLFISISIRRRVAERPPEQARKWKWTRWSRWKTPLPDDPRIRSAARLSQILNIASVICFIGGITLAETSWNIF
jgi:hypothetical protein